MPYHGNKKTINVYLDPDIVERARPYIKKMGFSLSSFLDRYLKTFVLMAEGETDLTPEEYTEAVQFWIKASKDFGEDSE